MNAILRFLQVLFGRAPTPPASSNILPLGSTPPPLRPIQPMAPPAPPAPRKAPLAAAVAAACALAAPVVMHFEGKRNVAYADPIGIPTSCYGHTGPEVQVGQHSTDAQCEALLNGDLARHAEAAATIAPPITQRPEVFAAATSFVYNVGAATFKRSTAARLFNDGRFADGCRALGRYVYAGHPPRKLPGLVKRREAEVALCLKGATP